MTRAQKLPKRLQPMLATLTDAPFDDRDWVFETKWDGFRMIADIKGGNVTLYSRNGKIISDSYRDVRCGKGYLVASNDEVSHDSLGLRERGGYPRIQLTPESGRLDQEARFRRRGRPVQSR